MREQETMIEENETVPASTEWANDVYDKAKKKLEGMEEMTHRELSMLYNDILRIEVLKLREHVNGLFYGYKSELGVQHVFREVTDVYGISSSEITSNTRKREIVEPRQAVHWLLRNKAVPNRLSLASVGGLTGGQGHATVLSSCRVVSNRMEMEQDFREEMMMLCNRLGARTSWNTETCELVVTGYKETPKNEEDETISDKTEGQAEHA